MKNKKLLLLATAIPMCLSLTGCFNLIKKIIPGGSKKASEESETSESISVESSPAPFSPDSDDSSSFSVSDLITYTCYNLPDWITNDGCVIFVWSWSPTLGSDWHAAYYTSLNSLEFYVGEELTGFLLARCKEGTTVPDWGIHDDSDGRVYNQTEDINCYSGLYEYECASWKEYH